MLSYTTPASIARNNAKAEEIMGQKLVGHGPDSATRPAPTAKHSELLAARKAG